MSDVDPWDFSEFSHDRIERRRDLAPSGSEASDSSASHGGSAGSAGGGWGGVSPDPHGAGYPELAADVSGGLVVGHPPVAVLVACLVAALLAGAGAAVFGTLPVVAVSGWVVAGPVAIGLLALFNVLDTRARASAVYDRAGWVRIAYVGALVLCGLAVIICALRIADWVGRW